MDLAEPLQGPCARALWQHNAASARPGRVSKAGPRQQGRAASARPGRASKARQGPFRPNRATNGRLSGRQPKFRRSPRPCPMTTLPLKTRQRGPWSGRPRSCHDRACGPMPRSPGRALAPRAHCRQRPGFRKGSRFIDGSSGAADGASRSRRGTRSSCSNPSIAAGRAGFVSYRALEAQLAGRY